MTEKLLTGTLRINRPTINNRKILNCQYFKQRYRYHKLRKAFSKFYRMHFELIEKYHVSLKKLMQQGICNPEFYEDLVYKFKKIIGNPNFSNLFKRVVNRFKRAGYTLDIMRQTACLVLTQSWLKAMLHSLVARPWFRSQSQWRLRCEARNSWLKLDDCPWLHPPWFN